MKMKTKIILYIAGCLLLGVVIAILTVVLITLPYIEKEETENIKNDIDRISLLLESEIQAVERTQGDWTWWNDSYDFAENKTASFVEDNLGVATLEQLNLTGMLFYDKDGSNIYTEYVNDDYKTVLQDTFSQKDTIAQLFQNVDEMYMNSGISVIGNRLFLVSAAGITSTDGTAQANGYLVMIKELDKEYMPYMEDLLGVRIAYRSGDTAEHHVFNGIAFDKIIRNGEQLTYYGTADDILHDNTVAFEVNGMRPAYSNAVQMLKTESAVLFAVFGILTVFIIIMVEKKEISRIVDLTKSVQAVSFTENRFPKISVGGKDEIALLGKNINCMLMELEKNYDAIKKNNEHLYHAMEVTNDGYFDYDITNQTIDISQTWLKYLGYENNLDLVTDIGKVLDGILPEDRQRFEEALHAFIQNGGELFYEEVRAYKAQHGYIWVLVRGGIIEYDREGNAVRFVGSLSDITKRKENENQKIFLLQTDPVTGLKNRAYMEKKLEEYKQEEDPVFSILMADVNGLKLINDAFGHREGDRLLKTIGDIITYCCDDADIPVRWGGDEFLVLVRNNRTYAENLMRRIKYELDLIVSFPIKISVAAGCSAYKKTDMDMEQVISRAEEKMYRNKLLESRSFHNGIIVTLEQTLYEKKIELPAAIERRQKICRDIGKQMHLSQETLDELDLLNLLHDIGKIELPDDLIFKTGGMTEEEIGRKKKHTETGYRIVKTIPEIAHIANSVLYHHESFDGSGYPTGISGDEIPITSRIFSVVNYFDFLTNRNGQNSVGQEEAKQMVMEKAGSKFDPEVVSVFIKVTEKKEYMD